MDKCPLIVATIAFGMGINKSNVSYVVHYNMPRSIENYYQEAGRAGRDGSEADCILLFSPKDIKTHEFLIKSSRPETEEEQDDKWREHKEREMKRLKYMIYYCSATSCLWHYILDYFGEKGEVYCGKCSNCANSEEVAITTEAQKIISCIHRLEQRNLRFGATMVIKILKGSKDKKIDQWKLNTLSTYGIMKDTSIDEIRLIINHLIANDYLKLVEIKNNIQVIDLGNNAKTFISEKSSLTIKKPKTDKVRKDTDEIDSELYRKLYDKRKEIAAIEQVPSYTILSDLALREMCKKKTLYTTDLNHISGFSQTKIRKYGKQFVEIVKSTSGTYKQNIISRLTESPIVLGELSELIRKYMLLDMNIDQISKLIINTLISKNCLLMKNSRLRVNEQGNMLGISELERINDYMELEKNICFDNNAAQKMIDCLDEVVSNL